jgi:hypothetical protein
VQVSQLSDTLVLDGIDICCGYADVPGHDQGGGLLVDTSNSSPVFVNQSHFFENAASEGSSVFNGAVLHLDSCMIANQTINGLTQSSVHNEGQNAFLKINNSTITQLCSVCHEIIKNVQGAQIQFENSVSLIKP